MKAVLLLSIFASFSAMGQNQYIDQLTTAEYKKEEALPAFRNKSEVSSTNVQVDKKHCDLEAQARAEMSAFPSGSPEFQKKLERVLSLANLCNMDVGVDENGDLVQISFTNDSKNAINPMTSQEGSSREFRLNFEERSKQNMNITITENSGLTGNMSHDLLESTIILIPRKVLPYAEVEQDKDSESCERKIFLPTGEFMILNAITNEIVAGVIKESKMDMTESRHQRKFAGLEYTGNGIMIRADRRAGTPEHIWAQSFNVNEKIAQATITRKGKTCVVSKELIWVNTKNADIGAYFKYGTDQEFLDKVINPICGWGLTLKDLD